MLTEEEQNLVVDRIAAAIESEMMDAEVKAIDALSRYKFVMFGYWAGIWVHLNRISGKKHPNPFKRLVREAQSMKS